MSEALLEPEIEPSEETVPPVSKKELEKIIEYWLDEDDGALKKFAKKHKEVVWREYEKYSKISRWKDSLGTDELEMDIETLEKWGKEMDVETMIAELLGDHEFEQWLAEKIPDLLAEATEEIIIDSDSTARTRKRVLDRLEMAEKDYKVGQALRKEDLVVAVHGGAEYESEEADEEGEKKITLVPSTDLDAKMATYLLGLADLSINRVEFIPKGESKKGAINLDTGNKNGVDIKKDGTLIFDHHGEAYMIATSATEQVYRTLVREGLLERQEWIEKMVSFINEVDNLSYAVDRKGLVDAWATTLYGLYDSMHFSDLKEFFEKGNDPKSELPKEWMRRRALGRQKTLQRLSNVRKKIVDYIDTNGIKRARENMRRLGSAFGTPELGSVLLNTVKVKISDGGQFIESEMPVENGSVSAVAARAIGRDSYVVWYEEQRSFFVSSTRDLGKSGFYQMIKEAYPHAKLIRGHMIISGQGEPENIEEFLKAIGMKL